MKRGFLRLAVALSALSLATAGTAAAEDGNSAIGSIGTVQVSPTETAPAADVNGAGAAADATVPVTVGETGGNDAQDAIGTVQAGGSNSSVESIGTAQVAGTSSKPAANASVGDTKVSAETPANVSGSGNDATRSVVSAQVGGPHSTEGTFAEAQTNDVDAGADVAAQSGDEPIVDVAPRAKVPAQDDSLADLTGIEVGGEGLALDSSGLGLMDALGAIEETLAPIVEATLDGLEAALEPLGAQLPVTDEVTVDIDTGTVELRSLGVSPDTTVDAQPVAEVTLGGSVGTGPNDGNSSEGSLGTGQIGSVEVAPTAELTSEALDSSVALGGASGVSGAGTNSVEDSLASVQAGGENSTSESIGTVQVGAVTVAPTLDASTPLGSSEIGGSSGIGGEGGNDAGDSVGTVQIGGGNDSEGSDGTVQSGPMTLGPTLMHSDTTTGETVELGGSSGIGGSGGNDAGESTGTVQIGGSNSSDSSDGTVQAGPVTLGQSVSFGPDPGGSVSGPGTIGSDGGNSADNSQGTVQIGGGNIASESVGTVQLGRGGPPSEGPGPPPPGTEFSGPPGARTLASAGGPSAPSSVSTGAQQGPTGIAAQGGPTSLEPRERPARGVLAARAERPPRGELPFTGFAGLQLLFTLGLALLGLGLVTRRHAVVA